ncbi:MAG: M23 family metallopeptidase [Candidatus Dormiibacterota bacterium]
MALPAALGAALSNVRGMRALASAVGGSAPRGSGRRAASCCSMSCLGCLACGALAGAVALSIGSALLAATASVVGIGGSLNCPRVSATACASLTGAAVGAPMNCPTMYVSQGYGDTPWEHPHAGMDIVCPPATMVVAVADGVFHRDQGAPIACSYPPGRLGGLGSFGVLSAGGRTYLYGHLEAFAAPDGAHVTIGQPLGFEGATGCATGYHLHFEVLENGRPIDPCPLLPAGYPDPHDSTGLRCWGAAPP